MIPLVIDRNTWIRGDETDGVSCLLNSTTNFYGCKCCLGFCAIQVFGHTDNEILGVVIPDSLPRNDKNADWFYHHNQEFLETNDSEAIDEKDREQKLTELFAKQGVAVSFIN